MVDIEKHKNDFWRKNGNNNYENTACYVFINDDWIETPPAVYEESVKLISILSPLVPK